MRSWLAALGVLTVVACECQKPPPPPPRVVAAQLLKASGTVTVESADAGSAPAAPGPLYLDDVVVTGAASRALLGTREGWELELGELTRFRVGSSGPSYLELASGDLTFLGGGDGGIEVLTPFGKAVFPADARGRLQMGADGNELSLTMGEITFIDNDGNAIAAKAGQRLSLKMGEIVFLDEAPADAGVPDGAVTVRFRRDRGAPALKLPGERGFKKVTEATELTAGTAFTVPGGAAAALVTEGISVRLASGAAGTFAGANRADGKVVLEVPLGAGSGTTLLSEGAALKTTSAQVKATTDATVALARTRAGSSVEVLAGEVEVASGSQRVTATSGQKVLTTAKSATLQPKPRGMVVLPFAPRLRIHGTMPDVELALPDDAARVEIARESSFADPLVAGAAKGFVHLPASNGEVLYARTLDAKGGANRTSTVVFRPDRATPRSASATETISETGQRATLYFQGEVPALTFAFAAQEKATRYRLKILKASNNQPVIVREVTEPRCTLERKALEEGEYVWYAAPLAADGSEQGSGALNRFELKFENAVNTLTITHPLPGEVASASGVASGVAPLKAKLFVNGRRATLDGQGRFYEPIGAVDTVVFRLVTGDAEGYWVRRLKRR